MNKISGYTCVRNGVELDYCFSLTIRSLLQVCSEVVVGYRDSTDDTLQILECIAGIDPRVRLFKQAWESPNGDIQWWTRWINETRAQLKHPVQLMLDADEVLDDDPEVLCAIRRIANAGSSSWFKRLNFVKDARHLIPSGACCGDAVARLGPTQYWMPSDEPHPEGEPEIRTVGVGRHDSKLNIFHYGFIRKMQAFYPKVDAVNKYFFGRAETRLEEHRKTNAENWYEVADWGHRLVPYQGRHPEMAIPWLHARGRL